MSDKLRTPADAPRDTAPQPPPVCCDPSAPIVKCCVCGADVHTCERTEPVDNDYRCPLHGNGVELNAGEWVCSDACGYERMLAGYVARIAALEAQLAEAQERLSMVVEALEQWAPPEFRICYRCKGVGTVATDTRGRPIPLAPCNYCDGSGINSNPRLLKTCAALSATAESVAQHTAEVERRGAAKDDPRFSRIYEIVTRLLAEPPDGGTGELVEIATICEARAAELEAQDA